jgi:hypothetical protein
MATFSALRKCFQQSYPQSYPQNMWTIGPEAVWPFDTCDCGLDPEKNDHSKGPAARTTARVGMLTGAASTGPPSSTDRA